jgi:hypothetical protein
MQEHRHPHPASRRLANPIILQLYLAKELPEKQMTMLFLPHPHLLQLPKYL